MKVHKKDPHADLSKILKERLGEHVYNDILTSLATMADIMACYLSDSESLKIPPQVKYAILQTFHYLSVMSAAFHAPEKLKEGIEALHFQSYNPRFDFEAEERFIFVVKEYYADLCKRKKI